MTENERLTIKEIIEHCNRHTERMESRSTRMQLEETPVGNSDTMKRYWEHRQVANYLEELESYRVIGTVEECRVAVEIVKKMHEHCKNPCSVDCPYYNPNIPDKCMNDLLK